MIASLLPGGLDAFKKLEEEEKTILRQSAIDTIGRVSRLFLAQGWRIYSLEVATLSQQLSLVLSVV